MTPVETRTAALSEAAAICDREAEEWDECECLASAEACRDCAELIRALIANLPRSSEPSPEVAAALERWETFKAQWPNTKAGENAFDIGDELARFLRSANPSKSSNSSPEPVPDEVLRWCRMYGDHQQSPGWAFESDNALRAYFARVYAGREVAP